MSTLIAHVPPGFSDLLWGAVTLFGLIVTLFPRLTAGRLKWIALVLLVALSGFGYLSGIRDKQDAATHQLQQDRDQAQHDRQQTIDTENIAAMCVAFHVNRCQIPAVGTAHGPSHIVADIHSQEYLYVADIYDGAVRLYSYQNNKVGKEKSKLTGFSYPYGFCTDGRRVWVTDFVQNKVLQYDGARLQPQAVLNDPGASPVSCAYDHATGNLAVANFSVNEAANGIFVYTHAVGSPTRYMSPNVQIAYSCAYDGHGNLYVDGRDSDGAFALTRFAKNSAVGVPITLKQIIAFPGVIVWDGRYLAVADQASPAIYLFQIAAGVATRQRRIGLTSGADSFIIRGSSLITSEAQGLVLYDYPSGKRIRRVYNLRTYGPGFTTAR